MSMKIGELLVQRGVIGNDKLQEALNAQLVYGGHLGTCLIELGHITETALGEVLSQIFDVGYARVEMLNGVLRNVIESLPRRLVEKHRVVPFQLADGMLHVAMIDPKNIHAIDETAFATGHKIQPWVAPEIRIFQAMEKYYGIPRRLRFIALCRELDRERPFERPARPAASQPRVRPNEPADPEPSVCEIGESDGSDASVNRGMEDLGAEFGYGRSWREIAGVDAAVTPAAASPAPAAVISAPPADDIAPALGTVDAAASMDAVGFPSLDETADRLCRAESVSQVSCAVLDYAAAGTPRCILWRVESVAASIWDWRGFGLATDTVRSIRIQVTSEPIFRLAAGAGCYRGPVPDDSGYRRYFQLLGAAIPREMLLVPIYLDDRLVALFYGDCGNRPAIVGEIHDYVRLMRKLVHSFDLLRLKQKIRAV